MRAMQSGHDGRAALHDDLQALVAGEWLSERDARILASARRRYESTEADSEQSTGFFAAVRALADAVADEIHSGMVFDLGVANGPAAVDGQRVVGSAISYVGLVERRDRTIAIVRARFGCVTEILAEFTR